MLQRVLTLLSILALSSCASGAIETPRPIWRAGETTAIDVRGIRDAVEGSTRPVHVLTIHGMIVPRGGYSGDMQAAIVAALAEGENGTSLRRCPRRQLTPVQCEEPLDAPVMMPLQRGYSPAIYDGAYRLSDSAFNQSELRITDYLDERGRTRLTFYELFWGAARDAYKYQFLGCFETRSLQSDAREAMTPAGQRIRVTPTPTMPEARARYGCPEESALPNTRGRDIGNGWLDDSIMVRGMPDAMIVHGPFGDVLRDDIALATCAMMTDIFIATRPRLGYLRATMPSQRCAIGAALNRSSDDIGFLSDIPGHRTSDDVGFSHFFETSRQNFVITESLGSYFFLEGQLRLARGLEDEENLLRFNLFRNSTVYMFANQVSLLYLGRLEVVCEAAPGGSSPAQCPNRLIERMTPPGPRAPTTTTYVAFNDANDLLGYELPPYLAHPTTNGGDPATGLRLINVSVDNPGWSIPFLLRSPMAAHTNQAKNRSLIRAIVDGFCIDAPGSAPPDDGALVAPTSAGDTCDRGANP